jgi:L-iditol 2-dehydrogenase
MKALIFRSPFNISVEEVKTPEITPDELLIKVGACGVCGTDFNIYEGKAPAGLNVIIGHEYAGEVIETGKNVFGFEPGDKVAIDPNIHCGYCEYCRQGRIHLCSNLKALGVTINGGFAEYSAAPFKQAYKLPETLDIKTAAFAEPLSCCIHGINQADVAMHNTVAIIGAGAIGILMLQLARIKGAKKIIVVETDPQKRDLALMNKADFVFDPSDKNFVQNINDVTSGGSDIVIECAGNAKAAETALKIAKKGGRLIIFGLSSPDAYLNINLQDLFHKELTIKSSLLNPNTFQTAVDMLGSKKISIESLNIKYLNLDNSEIVSLFSQPRNPSVNKNMILTNNQ